MLAHPRLLIALLALAVHVQLTVGARLAVSDLIVAVLVPTLLLAWKSVRPYPWVIGLVAVTLVFVLGFLMGPKDTWAITKFGGWFVLLAYGGVGLLIGEHYRLFAQIFILGLCSLVLTFAVMTVFGIHWSGPFDPRFSGLMGNPNAFALALVCGIALCPSAFDRWELPAALLAAGVFFSWSMAGILAFVLVAIVWLLKTRELISFARVALFAGLAYFSPLITNAGLHALTPNVPIVIGGGLGYKFGAILSQPEQGTAEVEERSRRVLSRSFEVRVRSNQQAIDLWKQSPILGAGLGTFWEMYRDKGTIIHSTPLWILTEFGIIGLFAFGFLFLSFAYHLQKQRLFAAQLVLIGWTVMALPHELMYQRIPWLVLGIFVGANLRLAHARADP